MTAAGADRTYRALGPDDPASISRLFFACKMQPFCLRKNQAGLAQDRELGGWHLAGMEGRLYVGVGMTRKGDADALNPLGLPPASPLARAPVQAPVQARYSHGLAGILG